MKLPHPSPNPRYGELRAVLAAHREWLAPWSGHFYRVQTLLFPTSKDILSSAGAKQRGGRWNPPGLAALYGSTTDTAALEEAKANDRYYGIETKTPRLLVAINAKVCHLIDLTSPAIRRKLGITLAELAGEDWRKLLQSGQESLSQSLGRAAASTGASGLLVRSASVRNAYNLVILPPLGSSGRLSIVEGEALAWSLAPKVGGCEAVGGPVMQRGRVLQRERGRLLRGLRRRGRRMRTRRNPPV